MPMAVRRLGGQAHEEPIGVAAQSRSRISAPVAPPASNICANSVGSAVPVRVTAVRLRWCSVLTEYGLTGPVPLERSTMMFGSSRITPDRPDARLRRSRSTYVPVADPCSDGTMTPASDPWPGRTASSPSVKTEEIPARPR